MMMMMMMRRRRRRRRIIITKNSPSSEHRVKFCTSGDQRPQWRHFRMSLALRLSCQLAENKNTKMFCKQTILRIYLK
jgi:hypothetical protein